MHIHVNLVGNKVKVLEGRGEEVDMVGLGSENKQEIGELLSIHVAGQEPGKGKILELEVEGYKWFEKPRSNQNSGRREGRVGFLVRECLVSEVEFITSVEYECVDESTGWEGKVRFII